MELTRDETKTRYWLLVKGICASDMRKVVATDLLNVLASEGDLCGAFAMDNYVIGVVRKPRTRRFSATIPSSVFLALSPPSGPSAMKLYLTDFFKSLFKASTYSLTNFAIVHDVVKEGDAEQDAAVEAGGCVRVFS